MDMLNDEEEKVSKNENEDTENKTTETLSTEIIIDNKKPIDEVNTSDKKPVKALNIEPVEVKPANKDTVEVKPPKRSPDNEDVMAPPAKVSRLLENIDNEKKPILLKIENIPGTFEETGEIIKQSLETEFGADSGLNLEKEQTDKQTNILLKIQNDEDAAAVFEKLKDIKINGKSLSVKKHYDLPKVVAVDLYDDEYEGTYGLSEDFLKELGIKLPLSKWVHVSNTNCQRNILIELMEYAGKVLYCNVIHTQIPYAKIMFSHPLEAVQAISLFNKQTFYGRLLTVSMVKPPPNEGLLPKGVQKIGTGFGPDGTPLRDILKQFERYYNGEKCHINYSVLESEKHKVPAAKKIDKDTTSTKKETKVVKQEEKKGEKREVIKEEKKEEKKELTKRYTSVMTQTYSLPSKLIQKMADLIKKGITVANIEKVLDRLADDNDDVVVVISKDNDRKLEKGKGKRERPRSVSPVAAKSVAKQPFKAPAKTPAVPFRPQKPISTRFTQSSSSPATSNKFNKPSFNNSSNSQQQNNNFSPNNNFNNHQPSFNAGVNNMGGFDHGNRNPNMGMIQNMGQNMQMGQQNIALGQQNMPMGQQNLPMGQQNIPIQQNVPMMQQNMPIAQANIPPMGQQNMAIGQHNNMGQNSMNPFNSLSQVVSMVSNAAANVPIGQTGHMGLGQMGQGAQPMGQSSQMGPGGQQMGQSGQMGQSSAMGQSGFQNQQVLLGQGTADYLVLVSNLPQSVTFKLLREKMSTCGDVKFLKMTNPGCAVVGYGELWEAQRCVASFNKTVVDGHKVELHLM